MEDIKMTNTKAAYAQLKPELDAAFNAVMENMQFVNGPQLESFARKLEEMVQVRHAMPCASGTVALQLALKALNLPAESEVILPAFCDATGAEVVKMLGLKPVFADVLPDTFNLDPAAAERAVSATTSAILPVHLFGQCAHMKPVLEMAQAHKLWVVEDSIQSLGATYTEPGERTLPAGAIGDMGVTSFFPTKAVGGTGEGGALLTNESSLAEKVQQLLTAGSSASGTALDTLQAAMLEVKIKIVDAHNKKREEVARFYDDAFRKTELVLAPYRAPYSSHVYQQYTIRVAPELRDDLQEYLHDNHIPSVVYYPKPLHLQEQFSYLHYKPGDFPVAESLSRSVLSLPMHSELKQDQLEYICHHVLTCTRRHA
ncbi:DegT/DnrJ/EryC1/StrS family aminotransferase [Pontibacter brevis]